MELSVVLTFRTRAAGVLCTLPSTDPGRGQGRKEEGREESGRRERGREERGRREGGREEREREERGREGGECKQQPVDYTLTKRWTATVRLLESLTTGQLQ